MSSYTNLTTQACHLICWGIFGSIRCTRTYQPGFVCLNLVRFTTSTCEFVLHYDTECETIFSRLRLLLQAIASVWHMPSSPVPVHTCTTCHYELETHNVTKQQLLIQNRVPYIRHVFLAWQKDARKLYTRNVPGTDSTCTISTFGPKTQRQDPHHYYIIDYLIVHLGCLPQSLPLHLDIWN